MHTGCLGMDCMCGWKAKCFDTLVSQLLWTLCEHEERKYWWSNSVSTAAFVEILFQPDISIQTECLGVYTCIDCWLTTVGCCPKYSVLRFTKMPTYAIFMIQWLCTTPTVFMYRSFQLPVAPLCTCTGWRRSSPVVGPLSAWTMLNSLRFCSRSSCPH